MRGKIVALVFVLTLIGSFFGITGIFFLLPGNADSIMSTSIIGDPIEPSNPSNVVVRESSSYHVATGQEDPIVEYIGVLYWEELAGQNLEFYVNTSQVIEASFKNYETKEPLDVKTDCNGATNCVAEMSDRYVITPAGRSFQYEIRAYYEPDIVEDTGFYVIFNSKSVDVSLEVEGETRYLRTDYYNQIILPERAGVISFSPNDEGYLGRSKTDNGRDILAWEYINRQMDSKHNPVLISVTYSFDEIYLAFSEQVYQNQIEEQQRQDEINRLNLIRQSFTIISMLSLITSILATFFAYLLARKKFDHELERAKELPKAEAVDIEEDNPIKSKVKSDFL